MKLFTDDQLWPMLLMALLVAWLVGLACVRPALIIGLALSLYAYESIFGASSGVSAVGILLYPRDGVYLAMAVSAAARILSSTEMSARPLRWTWWALVAIAVASFAKGVHFLGANSAGNDFRGFFYFASAVLFVATQRPDREWVRLVVDIWIGIGLLLALAGFARMMGMNIGAATSQEILAGGRAIYAGPTLIIGQAALLAFFAKPLGSRWQDRRWLPYLLLFAVLAFRHRTVWLMMVVSLVAMWTVLRPGRPVEEDSAGLRAGRGIAVIVAALCLVVLMVGGGAISTFRSQLDQSAVTASGTHSTSSWRIEGWKYLLKAQSASASSLVLGIPYGSGYTRKIGNTTVKVSPHSWYIQTITREGVVGFVFLMIWLGRLFGSGRRAGLLPTHLGALMVLSSMAYGIAYQPTETQGILLGIVALSTAVGSIGQEPEKAAGRLVKA